MKPRIQEKLDAMEEVIVSIQDAVRAVNDSLEHLQQEQETIRKEHWRQRKEIATLQRTGQEFTVLEQENAHLTEIQDQLHEKLKGLLGAVKALRNECQP